MSRLVSRVRSRSNSDFFSAALPRLDLQAAAAALGRNDLLPPRLEDAVGGEVGKRFTEALAAEIASGRYAPTRAVIVPVPKPGLTTRPAALVTLRDRVTYDALVGPLRPRIETYLVSSDVVFWPRASPTPKRWREFDSAPAQLQATHVALVDVAGYYESVRHDLLADILLDATGRSEIVYALIDFLGMLMGTDHGLPQGLVASDPLATVYLTPVDRAMLRSGIDYFRNGDDMRIAARSYADGVKAVAFVEAELRSRHLTLNATKTRIVLIDTYQRQLTHIAEAKSDLRKRLEERRLGALKGGDVSTMELVAEMLGIPKGSIQESADLGVLEETLLSFGLPYEQLTIDDLIDLVRHDLAPDDVEVACTLFSETVGRSVSEVSGELSKETFHERLQDALVTLSASQCPCALKECGRLLTEYPAETDLLTTYLEALTSTHAKEVADQVLSALTAPTYRHGWQIAWLCRPLLKVADLIPPETLEPVRAWLRDEEAGWLRRVSIAKLLAATGRLSKDDLIFLWRASPPACQPDLLEAAFLASRSGAVWATTFLEGCMGDRVNEVVVGHLGGISALKGEPESQ